MLNGNIIAGTFTYNCHRMTRNIVGPKVRLARKLSQPPLTQGELAARLQVLGLGVEQSSVSKIEQGLRPVSDIEVMVLSKALKVTVGWLLGEDSTSIPTFKPEQETSP
jgi:transcriptional regulator with XRE-family HTH domain